MHVQFDAHAKKHDGIAPELYLLDRIVYAYFSREIRTQDAMRVCVVKWGGASLTPNQVSQLVHHCIECLNRMSTLQGWQSTPLLIHGGGKGIGLRHVHYGAFQTMMQWLIPLLSAPIIPT